MNLYALTKAGVLPRKVQRRDKFSVTNTSQSEGKLTNVTVNSGPADQKAEYFHREIAVGNGSGPVWQGVSVSCAGATTNGGFVFPASSQTLQYDADGNLTFDGVWTYEWDAENRLQAMSMTNVAGIAGANRLRLEFTYDYQGRRVAKTVKTWNGSSFGSPVTTKFVYDGWNLLAILNSAFSLQTSFVWGPDLSGSLDGAGGIGGLVGVFEMANGQIANGHFAGYDGNGNVTVLVKAYDRSLSAQYEYSPFGELLRTTGPMARTNPFRFSTKFADEESGLANFGGRYYSPTMGRFVSRDKAEEGGGRNFYAFVLNRPTDAVDTNGESPFLPWAADLLAALLIAEKTAQDLDFQTGAEHFYDLQEYTERLMSGESGAPSRGAITKPRGVKPVQKISPSRQFVMRRISPQRWRWGGAAAATGGLFLAGTVAMAQEADALTSTFADYGRHLKSGEIAWADLDVATFAAQLQSGGSDYFFTMGVVSALDTVGQYALQHQHADENE